jgi:hypothetical protein
MYFSESHQHIEVVHDVMITTGEQQSLLFGNDQLAQE